MCVFRGNNLHVFGRSSVWACEKLIQWDFLIIIIIIIIINPLTARVVGPPQMILQPVFSIFFPLLHCPLGIGELKACLKHCVEINECYECLKLCFIIHITDLDRSRPSTQAWNTSFGASGDQNTFNTWIWTAYQYVRFEAKHLEHSTN